MTEAEALDLAAKAAGWPYWHEAASQSCYAVSVLAHAKTLMENAALKAENEALKALRDDDGELLTIAWMDGAHRSNKAHREQIAALNAENERLREALRLGGQQIQDRAFQMAAPNPWTPTFVAIGQELARTALERIDHD